MATQLDNFPHDAFRALLKIQPKQREFIRCYLECSEEVQSVVRSMFAVLEYDQTTDEDRQRAIKTIADALVPKPVAGHGRCGMDLSVIDTVSADKHQQLQRQPVVSSRRDHLDSQQATFAQRLRQILEVKNVTQEELAERIGCTQSAVSKMLSRDARPHKKTIFKMALALNIEPTELWPNLEVAAILDSVADFFEDRELTADQAKAIEAAGSRVPARVKTRVLPSRTRK